MIIQGKAVIIPLDKVDTDVMYPGNQLHITEPARMKDYLLEGLDPSVRQLLGSETIFLWAHTSAQVQPGSTRPWPLRQPGFGQWSGEALPKSFSETVLI